MQTSLKHTVATQKGGCLGWPWCTLIFLYLPSKNWCPETSLGYYRSDLTLIQSLHSSRQRKPATVILFVFMPCGSLHLFTIQIHYSIQNTQWPYISIFLHSIPEVHRPFFNKQCCINCCTWDRHSYNEALLLKEARCRQFGHFPVMGLTLGQTKGDVAAVKGCFMLFLCRGSCHPEDRLSNRSRQAKLNPS